MFANTNDRVSEVVHVMLVVLGMVMSIAGWYRWVMH
jgi:hypothetical protein